MEGRSVSFQTSVTTMGPRPSTASSDRPRTAPFQTPAPVLHISERDLQFQYLKRPAYRQFLAEGGANNRPAPIETTASQSSLGRSAT